MYQHPVIQKAVNCMWFKNRRDEGILFETLFEGMPLPAIALLLTAVRILFFIHYITQPAHLD